MTTMSLRTKEFAPAMKVAGGICGAVTLGAMVAENGFSGIAKRAATGLMIVSAFFALRGVDQILYGQGA